MVLLRSKAVHPVTLEIWGACFFAFAVEPGLGEDSHGSSRLPLTLSCMRDRCFPRELRRSAVGEGLIVECFPLLVAGAGVQCRQTIRRRQRSFPDGQPPTACHNRTSVPARSGPPIQGPDARPFPAPPPENAPYHSTLSGELQLGSWYPARLPQCSAAIPRNFLSPPLRGNH